MGVVTLQIVRRIVASFAQILLKRANKCNIKPKGMPFHPSAQIVIVGDGGSYLPEEIHFTAASSVNWCPSLYTAAINEDFTRVANVLRRLIPPLELFKCHFQFILDSIQLIEWSAVFSLQIFYSCDSHKIKDS